MNKAVTSRTIWRGLLLFINGKEGTDDFRNNNITR